MMALLQGRKVAVIGDSLAHQHFHSLACLLGQYLEPYWPGKWADKDKVVDMSLIPSKPWGSKSAVPSVAQNETNPFWKEVSLAIKNNALHRSKSSGLFGCVIGTAKLGFQGTSWYIKASATCPSIEKVRRLQVIAADFDNPNPNPKTLKP